VSVERGLSLRLEDVPCALCGASRPSPEPVFEGKDIEFRTCDNTFTFLECLECRHWYLSPRPREEDIGKIYANYLTHNDDSAYRASALTARLKRNVFDQRRMRPVLSRLGPGSNVLEVGAGSGDQLEFFQTLCDFPLTLYANDISFDAEARSRLDARGIDRLEGAIENVETETRFDAIVGVHVIEHVMDPKAVFRWLADHLAPGGILYLETPDTKAPARFVFKDNWGMTHFPRHFHLFSRESLRALATESGLSVVRHRATTSAPAWNMSIRNTLGMDALTRHKSIFEIFNYSNVFTLSFFTALDLALITLGFHTSTQQLIARKEIA